MATQIFFGIFTPKLGGRWTQFDSYFSEGLVQPPTSNRVDHSFDGSEILHVGSLSHYFSGFYTSQVVQGFFHQQYVLILDLFINFSGAFYGPWDKSTSNHHLGWYFWSSFQAFSARKSKFQWFIFTFENLRVFFVLAPAVQVFQRWKT